MNLPFLDWIKKYLTFSLPNNNLETEPNTFPLMKIAVVVGHHSKDGGAYSEYLKTNEFNFYSQVVKQLKDVNVFYHNENIKGYTSRIKDTATRINNFKADLVIECHFNAASPNAHGCETLYYFNSKKGKEYAQKFSDLVNRRTDIKLRNGGLKALVNSNDRGFASVYYPKAPAILVEPFFGTSMEDCIKVGGVNKMASILQEFIDNEKY